MNIQEDVIIIVANQLGLQKALINENDTLIDDLGADSIDLIEIVLALETKFDLDMSLTQEYALITIKDVITYVKESIMVH